MIEAREGLDRRCGIAGQEGRNGGWRYPKIAIADQVNLLRAGQNARLGGGRSIDGDQGGIAQLLPAQQGTSRADYMKSLTEREREVLLKARRDAEASAGSPSHGISS